MLSNIIGSSFLPTIPLIFPRCQKALPEGVSNITMARNIIQVKKDIYTK